MASKFGRTVTSLDGLTPFSYSTPTSCGLERSRDKLKPLYLHYHKAYDHQTWIVGDLTCEASIQIVTSSFNHVVLLDHTTN